ncbi:hypothetical protein [Vibrio gallaecicus]|uniref:Uncharacterized protein n=1 Tax=Vibrio gallaecicus TaxID=552386 RepID=A0ABV4NHR0_9VIBR
MNEGFIRQRRNLYTVSGILLFCFLAQVKISQLSVVGISFSGFDKPEVTFWFLWCIWGYFFYRFIVYFYEYESCTFKNFWRREMGRYCDIYLIQLARSQCSGNYLNNASSYYQMKANGWTLSFQEEKDQDEIGGVIVENRIIKVYWWQILKYQIFGIIRFTTMTPAVTDYIFPFIGSLLVFVFAGILGLWQGALFEIIN